MKHEPTPPPSTTPAPAEAEPQPALPKEIGGSSKPEPTRYGDWEIGGKCVDF
jgi:hypothetical protein